MARHDVVTDARLTTILRPWYVIGPGHYWPLAVMPAYWVMERVPATRDMALRLGLVTIGQVIAALVQAVENPPHRAKVLEVPQIRAAGAASPATTN